MPGCRLSNLYNPSEVDFVVRSRPVSTFLATTVALATTAPWGSSTVPTIVAVAAVCALPTITHRHADTISISRLAVRLVILDLSFRNISAFGEELPPYKHLNRKVRNPDSAIDLRLRPTTKRLLF